LSAARALRGREDIVFLFVGDGPRHHEVAAAKRLHDLGNVRLLDFFARGDLHASLSVADAHLVSQRPEMTGICVPGKLYGAMASSRPVLFVGPAHCEVADTIRDAGCGRAFAPGDWRGLVETIGELAADEALAREMGERGLSAFVAEHERDACCAQWCWLLDDLISGERVSLGLDRDRSRPGKAAPRRASPVHVEH
jgi:glycosyltransferase involved in cell wall biosynthesis